MKFYLDGQLIAGAIDGTDDSVFTEQRKQENGRLSRSYSAELTFYDDGYTIIRDKLITPLDGNLQKITAIVRDECCKDENGNDSLLFIGIIRGDSIDWCEGDCFVKATLIEETEETVQMDCVKSTLIYDNQNGFQNLNHPRVKYCIEMRPSFMQELILVFGILFNIVLIVLTPLVFVISLLVQLVCLIPGVNCPESLQDGILDDYLDWMRRMNKSLIGCGRVHPTPLVRDYISNVCTICGIGFSSSILNTASSDFYNLLYYNNPVEKGVKDLTTTYILENKPIKTLEGLLEELKIPFNAEYRIIDGVLYFERYDFFRNGTQWFDYATLKAAGMILSEPCYEWRGGEKQAAANFQYTDDPVDWVGNEAIPFYNDVVGQNTPYSTLQSGIKEVVLPFGVPRFRDDLIDIDVLGLFALVPFLKAAITSSNGALIQNNGTNFNPKLIIWDGVDVLNAKVRQWPVVSTAEKLLVKINNAYPISRVGHNYVMQFNEDGVAPNTAYPTDTPNMGLYGRFHSIDNPQILTDRGLNFTMEIKYNCDIFRDRGIYKTITLPVGKARINKMELTPDKQSILIFGEL